MQVLTVGLMVAIKAGHVINLDSMMRSTASILGFLWGCSLAHAQNNLRLLHRVYHPLLQESSFVELGTVDLSEAASLQPTDSFSKDLSKFSQQLESLDGAQYMALYQVALDSNPLEFSSVKAVSRVVFHSIHRALFLQCHVHYPGHSINLYAREATVYSLDYFVSIPNNAACDGKPVVSPFEMLAGRPPNITIAIHSARLPPLPELKTPPPMTAEGEPVKPAPEKSFLQKYWMYIVAILLALSMPLSRNLHCSN